MILTSNDAGLLGEYELLIALICSGLMHTDQVDRSICHVGIVSNLLRRRIYIPAAGIISCIPVSMKLMGVDIGAQAGKFHRSLRGYRRDLGAIDRTRVLPPSWLGGTGRNREATHQSPKRGWLTWIIMVCSVRVSIEKSSERSKVEELIMGQPTE